MLIEIYHAKEPNFGFATSERPDPVWPDGFTHVANIQLPYDEITMVLETAFQLTNHIDEAWHESELAKNKEALALQCLVEKPRSTSVGDMAVVDGKRYLCAPLGWTEIAPDGS